MPIFEYVCQECGHRFETIVNGSRVPSCPSCQARNLEKQLSLFAVGRTEGSGTSVAPCGTCGDPRGPGACAMD